MRERVVGFIAKATPEEVTGQGRLHALLPSQRSPAPSTPAVSLPSCRVIVDRTPDFDSPFHPPAGACARASARGRCFQSTSPARGATALHQWASCKGTSFNPREPEHSAGTISVGAAFAEWATRGRVGPGLTVEPRCRADESRCYGLSASGSSLRRRSEGGNRSARREPHRRHRRARPCIHRRSRRIS